MRTSLWFNPHTHRHATGKSTQAQGSATRTGQRRPGVWSRAAQQSVKRKGVEAASPEEGRQTDSGKPRGSVSACRAVRASEGGWDGKKGRDSCSRMSNQNKPRRRHGETGCAIGLAGEGFLVSVQTYRLCEGHRWPPETQAGAPRGSSLSLLPAMQLCSYTQLWSRAFVLQGFPLPFSFHFFHSSHAYGQICSSPNSQGGGSGHSTVRSQKGETLLAQLELGLGTRLDGLGFYGKLPGK